MFLFYLFIFIERSLKHGGVLDEGVFSTLDKMESLQNKRAERWGDKMDKYASERERLVEQLTICFENLEQEIGIFLINVRKKQQFFSRYSRCPALFKLTTT